MDIEITQAAKNKILENAKEYNTEPTVRIYTLNVGCSGSRFGIVFDEPKQFDVMTEVDGIEIVTDSDYVPKFSDGLSVDYVEEPAPGFIIKSLRPIGGASGKATNSSCGGCGCGGCGKAR